MTWTYTPALLLSTGSTATMHKVRRLVGDVDTTRQLLQDEELFYVIANESSPTLAAAGAADLLAAYYAFLCNTDNGELRISAAARGKHYVDLADRLRKGGAGEIPGNPDLILATMYVGGQSRSAVADLNSDSDNAAQTFTIGQDDKPGINTSSSTGAF